MSLWLSLGSYCRILIVRRPCILSLIIPEFHCAGDFTNLRDSVDQEHPGYPLPENSVLDIPHDIANKVYMI